MKATRVKHPLTLLLAAIWPLLSGVGLAAQCDDHANAGRAQSQAPDDPQGPHDHDHSAPLGCCDFAGADACPGHGLPLVRAALAATPPQEPDDDRAPALAARPGPPLSAAPRVSQVAASPAHERLPPALFMSLRVLRL